MKNVMSKKALLVAVMALISLGVYAQHDHSNHGDKKKMAQHIEPVFKNKEVGSTYSHYIALKDALVASQSGEVQKAAEKLKQSLESVKDAKTVQEEADKIASASNLDDQRKAFASLSKEMAVLVKANAPSKGEVYLDYCPMANGNTGAYWLSSQREIKNPYFGDKMLKCGSVKETIK